VENHEREKEIPKVALCLINNNFPCSLSSQDRGLVHNLHMKIRSRIMEDTTKQKKINALFILIRMGQTESTIVLTGRLTRQKLQSSFVLRYSS
jgi:hypothetical protein